MKLEMDTIMSLAEKPFHLSGATVLALLTLVSLLPVISSDSADAQITVLKNVTVIDGSGKPPRRNVSVIVEGDKIRAVKEGGAAVPSGATVLDLSGKTIMPEIINAHGHLGLLKGTKLSPDNYTEDNVERQLMQYQDYGVGAVLVMGTDHDDAYAWREESHAGTRPGALLYTAGRGFGVPDGLPPLNLGMTSPYRPLTPEEARKDVRELAAHHPDYVKIWVDDFWGQYPKMKPEIYEAIIEEAHKQHLRIAAHIYHEEDAQRLVDLGIDVIAHSVRDAEIPDTLVEEMKRKHVAYLATLALDDFAVAYGDDPPWLDQPFFRDALEPGAYDMITSPAYKQSVQSNRIAISERSALPIALKNLKKVYDAGVLVALGTDSGANPVRFFGFSEHIELQLLVQGGLTPLQAITVATMNGAELLRAAHEIGSLSPGLRANFVVLDKDPTIDIRNTESIVSVWKNGKKVSDGPHPRPNVEPALQFNESWQRADAD
jgi:imidazolonepropionase-like amidohydrolase